MSPPRTPLTSVGRAAARHGRRRVVGFAAFGVTGLLLSATWAAGVISTNAGATSPTVAPLTVGAAPSGSSDSFAGLITNAAMDAGLPMNFLGRWGNIPADADTAGASDPDAGGDYELFELDLDDFAVSRKFFVEIGLANTPNDFTALQIEFVKVDSACATADLDNTGAAGYATGTLYAESADATVVFTNMTGPGATVAKKVCVGVADTNGASAMDADGTFIRRITGDTTAPDPMPAFFAVLGEHT